jgi:hypothetical protein
LTRSEFFNRNGLRLRERMAGGDGDIAAGSISISEVNTRDFDFTIPTVKGVRKTIFTRVESDHRPRRLLTLPVAHALQSS